MGGRRVSGHVLLGKAVWRCAFKINISGRSCLPSLALELGRQTKYKLSSRGNCLRYCATGGGALAPIGGYLSSCAFACSSNASKQDVRLPRYLQT